jgi:D-arabinose 1-dehydrogenase-like Zn-dependent alcohol dehydrogenase
MATRKQRIDSVAGAFNSVKAAQLGLSKEWPSVVDLPKDETLRAKSIQIFEDCISTRERDGFNAFERTQAATLAITTANYLIEMMELETEGNLLPNPTNPKYKIRNPRLDVAQSLSATRSNLAKALKLFSAEDSRTITSRKKAFDSANEAINRSKDNNYDDLLA